MHRILLVVLLSGWLAPSWADDRAVTRQQIDAARQDIQQLQQVLKKIEQEKSGVQQKLRETESNMGRLQREVDTLQKDIEHNQKELQQLDEQKNTLEGARLQQQDLIGQQARSTYQSGRQEYLKLLLNQQSPELFSRSITYYEYLHRARQQQIDAFNQTITQLKQVETTINEKNQLLAQQQQSLSEQRHALEAVKQEHQAALASITKQQSDRQASLRSRQKDQAQLEQVLRTIEATLAQQAREREERARQEAMARAAEQNRLRQQQAQTNPSANQNSRSEPKKPSQPAISVSHSGNYSGGPFAQSRGRLPWPINGQMVARYGTPRGDDPRSRWDGVLISAAAGTPVKAIHGGRVVFADWLRGSGLLVILDHGNGYLSLYGHNQSLLRQAGDIVKPGDNIATVGSSGGQAKPALYFAIRQQGRPSDPSQWCRSQG